MSDYRSGPGSLGYRAASVLTTSPALIWRNAKLKVREGAFGTAQVPGSVAFAQDKGHRQSDSGRGPRKGTDGDLNMTSFTQYRQKERQYRKF